MFSDRDVENYYARFDPAYMTDDEPADEHEQEVREIMADLFKDLEKAFGKLTRYDKEALMDRDDEVIEKIYELMEV